MVSIEDIYEAYYDCRKNKRNTFNALAFEMDYERNLHELWHGINCGSYTIGRSICFVVTRPKPREVFAADFRDRIVHHLVIRKIEPVLERHFIDDSYSCRKGKGVLYGVMRLRSKMEDATDGWKEEAWVAKFDCSGFFMSISKPLLADMAEKFVRENYDAPDKETIIHLLRMIIMHCPQNNCIRQSPLSMWRLLPENKSLFTCGDDYGLPIGNLSSQVLANFYLSWFDKWMNERFNGFYGRYVDDFYVIARDKAAILSSIGEIRERLAALHVTLHPKKMYIQQCHKGVKFTGGIIKPHRVYAARSLIGGLARCVRELNAIQDKSKHVAKAMQRLNSYLGFCVHYDSYGMRVRQLMKLAPE